MGNRFAQLFICPHFAKPSKNSRHHEHTQRKHRGKLHTRIWCGLVSSSTHSVLIVYRHRNRPANQTRIHRSSARSRTTSPAKQHQHQSTHILDTRQHPAHRGLGAEAESPSAVVHAPNPGAQPHPSVVLSFLRPRLTVAANANPSLEEVMEHSRLHFLEAMVARSERDSNDIERRFLDGAFAVGLIRTFLTDLGQI
jgi:hypothetical protein